MAYQLPGWWETAALTLACWRVGALAVPVLPAVRAHGLERILRGTQARVCVVPDEWEGFAHAEVLAELAPRLPWLRRRVVVGGRGADGRGRLRRVLRAHRARARTVRAGAAAA
ncbi:hypothetical protein GCM10020000_52460 [Streptomyces olivoverticillatus]